jgi:putative phosphoribosyl transferase
MDEQPQREALRRVNHVFAPPVCARDSRDALCADADADEVVYVSAPPEFGAVGLSYRDFGQTSDEEVLAALADRTRT